MNRTTLKLMMVGAFVACAGGGLAIGLAWATPGAGIATTIVAGPSLLDEIRVRSDSDVNDIRIRTRGLSDVYVVHNRIVPGGHTGWHSHPSRGLDCTYLIGTEGIAVLDAHRPRLNVWADEEPWATPPRHPDDPMGFWSSTATYRQKRAWLATAAGQHDVVHFLDSIEGGKPSAVPATMAAAATEVLLAAYQSAATGKDVQLPLRHS